MIGKQNKGKGFGGLLKYVLSKEGAEIVGKNMLGDTAEELSSEFSESRKLRPNLKKCVYHASLSLPEGDHLISTQWREVADTYMDKMGFAGAQYVAVLHQDTKHQHIHIVASRVRLDGTVVSDSNDYKRSEKVLRGIEKEFGLTPVKSSLEVGRKAPTTGELRRSLREGQSSTKSQLQGLIDAAVLDTPSMSGFIKKMESSGVGVLANVAKTGHVTGISFILNGEQMKGSDLGKKYSWKGLLNQGVSYDHDREIQTVINARQRATLEANVANHSGSTRNRRHESGRISSALSAVSEIIRPTHRGDRTANPEFKQVNRRSQDLSSVILANGGKSSREFEGIHPDHDTKNLGGRDSWQRPDMQSSREQLLRLGLSVFAKSRKNNELGLFREYRFSEASRIVPEKRPSDFSLIVKALEPFEETRLRKLREERHRQETQAQKRLIEIEREIKSLRRDLEIEHNSRSKGMGFDISF